jgi:hypothetical protein
MTNPAKRIPKKHKEPNGKKTHMLLLRKTKKPNRASGLYIVRKCAENIPQKVKWDTPKGKMGHPKW